MRVNCSKNFYNNKVSYKVVVDGIIRGILFGCGKGETNDALNWVNTEMKTMSSNEFEVINNSVAYLSKFDELLSSHMTQKDMKVALFISNKRGCGSMLLDHYRQVCKENKKENLFLWTDSTCSYQYYPRKGFEEILRVDMANQNRTDEAFQTILYKKPVR